MSLYACVDPRGPKMLAQYPELAVRLQVFTGSFDLVIRPAGSPCLATRASEMRSRVLRVSFLAKGDEAFLNGVHEQGLAELEPGNVAVQIGRIFRVRRARLPSYWCRRRQVLQRSQGRELVGLWRYS